MSTPRSVLRVLTLALMAGATSACSSVPDWVDPTTWGSSAGEPATNSADSSPAAPDQTGSEGKTVAEAGDKYPVLADTPSKAPPSTSTDEQKQVTNALVADRAQAQYSAEALQAGNEPAAAPPPPASAETSAVVPPPSSAPNEQTSTASTANAPATQTTAADTSASTSGTPAETGQAASTTQVASAAPSPQAPPPPAPPTSTPPAASNPPAAAYDAGALGFQPSHAPPLDPAVAQIVGGGAAAASQRLASTGSAAPAPTAPAFPSAATTVVAFPAQTIALDASAIAQVQAAVAAFKARGGTGYVRVVGHSASGAPNLSADKQMMQSFERSQAVATAVARELIKEGVPANRVLVDATSSLAADEQRRAEIFLQS